MILHRTPSRASATNVMHPRSIVAALWCLLGLLTLATPALAATTDEAAFDLNAFGRIPVSAEGRVKPLDSVARHTLMTLSGRQTLQIDGTTQPAIRWLADMVGHREGVNDYEVFRIDHPDIVALIGQADSGRKRFSFNELRPHEDALLQQARQAAVLKPADRNLFQKRILELFMHLNVYWDLSQLETPYVIPPLSADEEWRKFTDVFAEFQRTGQVHPTAGQIAAILSAYQTDNAARFNAEVAAYTTFLKAHLPRDVTKARTEVTFNRVAPFYIGTVLYVVTFLVVCVTLLLSGLGRMGGARGARNGALALLVVTFLLHTVALLLRMWLQGRPPVTNLYSSAIFIGWVCVLLGLFIEAFYRNGLGTLAASLIGFITLIIAHNLAAGDTMEMMQAVLDSNFWLATHVTTVTIGYSATFLAGFLGIALIALGVLSSGMPIDEKHIKNLGTMIYGTVAFALLFSFVGTVLGGIWADQSWGRFWGWDPKENGAVLIVLGNALILHARWGGMVRQRGMAVLAVGGNIITAWSWFGTNMLGVGLHSYGFMDSAVFWLSAFVVSQLLIMAIGLAPLPWGRAWRNALAEV